MFRYNFHVVIGANSDIIQAFAALVRSEIEDERVDLLRSALTFARIEDPQLDIERYVRRVDELAARVAEKIQDPDDPVQIIVGLNDVLFQEEMFRGNTVDYYSPRNSFLHDVLDRRLGVPITLAVVYLEVARRVDTERAFTCGWSRTPRAIVNTVATVSAAVRSPPAPVSAFPVQTSSPTATAVETASSPTLNLEWARARPDVQRATTSVPLCRNRSTLLDQEASGAAAANTNEATTSRRTSP